MKDIAAAMAKAQTQIKAAIKDTKGQVGKGVYKYADLASVWDACKAGLSANGIAVIQKPDFDTNGVMWLETLLLHSSGDCITGRYPLRPTQDTPQAYGSAITYARRYSLSAMVGIVTDEDDDGAAGSRRDSHDEPPSRPVAPTVEERQAAAKSYVDEAIKAIGTLTDAAGLNAWVEANKSKLERLRDVYDEGSRQVSGAILEQRKALMRGAAE